MVDSVKTWNELEPGMVITPSPSTGDRYVIFYEMDGSNEIGILSTIGTVTVLKVWIIRRGPGNPDLNKKSNLCMMVALTGRGVVGIVTTDAHPADWCVTT